MICITESFWYNSEMQPTQGDLDDHGLTREQYNSWKANNPGGLWRKTQRFLDSQGFRSMMSGLHFLTGGPRSVASNVQSVVRASPQYGNIRSWGYMKDDLEDARKYYDQNPVAAKT